VNELPGNQFTRAEPPSRVRRVSTDKVWAESPKSYEEEGIMTKRVSLVLALALVVAMMIPSFASAEEMTDVGTPRAQTLICEPDADVYACPGQFNPYMTGTQASWGMHQIMWSDGLWDVNTMTGETIPTVAAELATWPAAWLAA
jgi:hypothetical protein